MSLLDLIGILTLSTIWCLTGMHFADRQRSSRHSGFCQCRSRRVVSITHENLHICHRCIKPLDRNRVKEKATGSGVSEPAAPQKRPETCTTSANVINFKRDGE